MKVTTQFISVNFRTLLTLFIFVGINSSVQAEATSFEAELTEESAAKV